MCRRGRRRSPTPRQVDGWRVCQRQRRSIARRSLTIEGPGARREVDLERDIGAIAHARCFIILAQLLNLSQRCGRFAERKRLFVRLIISRCSIPAPVRSPEQTAGWRGLPTVRVSDSVRRPKCCVFLRIQRRGVPAGLNALSLRCLGSFWTCPSQGNTSAVWGKARAAPERRDESGPVPAPQSPCRLMTLKGIVRTPRIHALDMLYCPGCAY